MSRFSVQTCDLKSQEAYFDGIDAIDFKDGEKLSLDIKCESSGKVISYLVKVNKNGEIDVKGKNLRSKFLRFCTLGRHRSDTEKHIVSQCYRVKTFASEGEWASNLLSSNATKAEVKRFATDWADKIENNSAIQDSDIKEHVSWQQDNYRFYPVSDTLAQPSLNWTKSEFVNYLRQLSRSSDSDAHIRILADTWRLGCVLLPKFNPGLDSQNGKIYKNEITRAREHVRVINGKPKSTSRGCIGNAQTPDKHQLMQGLKSRYWYAKNLVFQMNNSNSYVKKLNQSDHEYVSGASGMANGFCENFEILGEKMPSDRKQSLMSIMTAFIVACGAHSKAECEYAFKLTDDNLQYTKFV